MVLGLGKASVVMKNSYISIRKKKQQRLCQKYRKRTYRNIPNAHTHTHAQGTGRGTQKRKTPLKSRYDLVQKTFEEAKAPWSL